MANPANSTAYKLSDGRIAVNVTENKTLGIDDCGYVQNVTVDGVVVTLPAVGAGQVFTVRNGGVKATNGPTGAVSDGSCGLAISPNALDKIQGGVDGTATDNKDLLNAKATSRVGDEVTLMGGHADGHSVVSIKGTWTREA